jgi:hypothetical protein
MSLFENCAFYEGLFTRQWSKKRHARMSVDYHKIERIA